MSDPAPIALFAYCRPDHLRAALQALQKSRLALDSNLYAFCDGPKPSEGTALRQRIESVQELLKTTRGFRSVNLEFQEQNLGLANSVISGVSKVLSRHDRLIVIEDDLVVAENFLEFMNAALACYQSQDQVFSISGYNYSIPIPEDYPYDAYFSHRCSSWGWATWRNRWEKADWVIQDFDFFKKSFSAQRSFERGGEDLTQMLEEQMSGKIDSWAIRWCYAHHKNNAYCLYPVKSKLVNAGNDGSGTHCPDRPLQESPLENQGQQRAFSFPKEIQINAEIHRKLIEFHKVNWKHRLKKRIRGIRRLLRIAPS